MIWLAHDSRCCTHNRKQTLWIFDMSIAVFQNTNWHSGTWVQTNESEFFWSTYKWQPGQITNVYINITRQQPCNKIRILTQHVSHIKILANKSIYNNRLKYILTLNNITQSVMRYHTVGGEVSHSQGRGVVKKGGIFYSGISHRNETVLCQY
jgi:hypothetical protein